MDNLIPIQEKDGVQSVNARKLHKFLEVGRDFTNWMKQRIEKYGFIKGEDFSPVLAKTPGKGGRPSTEYEISIDMAKELSMVENNDRGRQARKYFIEAEKRYREQLLEKQAPPQEEPFEVMAARTIAMAQEKIKKLELENRTVTNVLKNYDVDEDCHLFRETLKKHFGRYCKDGVLLTQAKFIDILIHLNIREQNHNRPKAEAVKNHWAVYSPDKDRKNGTVASQLYITKAGRERIARYLAAEGYKRDYTGQLVQKPEEDDEIKDLKPSSARRNGVSMSFSTTVERRSRLIAFCKANTLTVSSVIRDMLRRFLLGKVDTGIVYERDKNLKRERGKTNGSSNICVSFTKDLAMMVDYYCDHVHEFPISASYMQRLAEDEFFESQK